MCKSIFFKLLKLLLEVMDNFDLKERVSVAKNRIKRMKQITFSRQYEKSSGLCDI